MWAKGHDGALAASARASIGGYAIGTWLAELWATVQVPAGEQGAIAPERCRALEEIDPWWCPTWPITWQRAYATARQWWLECDGLVDWTTLPLDTVYEGEQLGRWVKAQRAGRPGLEADQRDLLAAIGLEENPELVAVKAAAKARLSRTDRFTQGLAALAAFVERERHPRVPRPHKEPVEAGPAARIRSSCRISPWVPGSTTPRHAGPSSPGAARAARRVRGRVGVNGSVLRVVVAAVALVAGYVLVGWPFSQSVSVAASTAIQLNGPSDLNQVAAAQPADTTPPTHTRCRLGSSPGTSPTRPARPPPRTTRPSP
ncbi:helicase associated domain-containing protein [Kitasatospora sp. NPDC048365]|uniref:helicase associated domain-containing protein n=1 Tax=Kitasatospora sp. NPDC048365 TaxID=3364050 RepID=UPI003723FBAB